MLRILIYPLSVLWESGGKYLGCLVFIHHSWVPFQTKVRVSINLPCF